MERKIYTTDFRYTENSIIIDKAFYNIIAPVFKKYTEVGYSPRELAHLVKSVVTDLELEAVLFCKEYRRKEAVYYLESNVYLW